MKTIREVEQWCAGAEMQFGDPAIPVGQVFARYVADTDLYMGDDVVVDLLLSFTKVPLKPYGLHIRLWPRQRKPCGVEIEIAMDGPKFALGQLLTFGVRPVAPGLWYLYPSLNLPGQIHAFVVLYDVPTPAPWDSEFPPASRCKAPDAHPVDVLKDLAGDEGIYFDFKGWRFRPPFLACAAVGRSASSSGPSGAIAEPATPAPANGSLSTSGGTACSMETRK